MNIVFFLLGGITLAIGFITRQRSTKNQRVSNLLLVFGMALIAASMALSRLKHGGG